MSNYVVTIGFPHAFYNIETSEKLRAFVGRFSKILGEFSGTAVETLRSHMSYEISPTTGEIDSLLSAASAEMPEIFGDEWMALASAR